MSGKIVEQPRTPEAASGMVAPGRGGSGLMIIETILRDRARVFNEIRAGTGLKEKSRAMVLSSVIFLALYGAVMGSTHSVLQALTSAVKLPLLFLATLAICAPTLYFFNLIFGSSQTLSQSVTLMLTAITVTSVVLVSFAPIVLFFLLTSSQYQFFKLLNVTVFAIAGTVGVVFLAQGMRVVSEPLRSGCGARANVVRLWILVYAFVGSQVAWTLRPFVGAPSMPFELLRPLGGSFYANVMASLGEVLGFMQ